MFNLSFFVWLLAVGLVLGLLVGLGAMIQTVLGVSLPIGLITFLGCLWALFSLLAFRLW